MEEYTIEKKDFEKKKFALREFANQPTTTTELDTFSTNGKLSDFLSGGLLGLTSHKVTGEEMNELVTELQNCFTEINERDRRVVKEFGQVYETFEALDKGYIQGILIGVKSAEEASKEARDAQKDVDDTIKALQVTITKLKEFKDEVKSYTHLKDIDSIWNDFNECSNELTKLSKRLKDYESDVEGRLLNLSQIKSMIEKQKHFKEIDEMWNKLKEIDNNTQGINDRVMQISSEIKLNIEVLLKFKDEIDSQCHFRDIDVMWNQQQKILFQVEEQSTFISRLNDEIGKCMSENSKLKTNLMKVYIIVGGALGVTIIQFILSMVGVI